MAECEICGKEHGLIELMQWFDPISRKWESAWICEDCNEKYYPDDDKE